MSQFLIDISICYESEAWDKKFAELGEAFDLEAYVKKAILISIEKSKAKLVGDIEISILFTNDDGQKKLNKQFRDIDKSTNVLSFPALEGVLDIEGLVGDISFAFETLEKEAKEQRKDFLSHFVHLIIHGFLHLIGYDHQNDKEALVMENLEIKILQELAIKNPYLD